MSDDHPDEILATRPSQPAQDMFMLLRDFRDCAKLFAAPAEVVSLIGEFTAAAERFEIAQRDLYAATAAAEEKLAAQRAELDKQRVDIAKRLLEAQYCETELSRQREGLAIMRGQKKSVFPENDRIGAHAYDDEPPAPDPHFPPEPPEPLPYMAATIPGTSLTRGVASPEAVERVLDARAPQAPRRIRRRGVVLP